MWYMETLPLTVKMVEIIIFYWKQLDFGNRIIKLTEEIISLVAEKSPPFSKCHQELQHIKHEWHTMISTELDMFEWYTLK